MGFHMAFGCDMGSADDPCTVEFPHLHQPVSFDSLDETWGDMIHAMEDTGWHIHLDVKMKTKIVLCPTHAPRKTCCL